MSFINEYNSFVREVKNLIQEKNYAQAAIFLKNRLEKEPNDRSFQLFYSSVLLKLNNYEEARFWLSKVIKKYEKSSDVDAFYYKGLYYFLKGNFNLSMESLRKCFMKDIYYLKKLMYDPDFEIFRDSEEFKELIKPTKEFKINEFITLKLIFTKTLIYICGDLFLTCQKVALSLIPSEFEKYEDFDNIDDIIDFYRLHRSSEHEITITPEEEFWAHCSNMQTWVEHNYDTRVLTNNLSFPILKELFQRGFSFFTIIFKRELLERIKKGGTKVLTYFIDITEDNYLSYLDEEDLFNGLLPFEEAELMRDISQFIPLEYTLTTSLLDSRRYPSLRDNKKMHFCIRDNHITELEILLDFASYSSFYENALLQIKNLKFLEKMDIYKLENIEIDINCIEGKYYCKTLYNYDDLISELRII